MPQLTKAQRNQIVRALVAGNLNPAECELYYDENSETIRHVPSGSVITRGPDKLGNFILNYRIGSDPARTATGTGGFTMFATGVKRWATEVREWAETPDLWELALSGGFIPGQEVPESANTPFTSDEQTAISAQLKEIGEAVKKLYELTAEQSMHIDKKFEEAEKASQRMGRKDWGMFFGGALLSLILSDTITPAIMGDILMMMQHGIGHLFMGAPAFRGILSAGQD